MDETTPLILSRLTAVIESLLAGRSHQETLSEPFEPSGNPALDELVLKIRELNEQYHLNRSFILDLAGGKLSADPPRGNSFASHYKQLHSELKHLTWQIQQIANGDYSQQVTFSGDFAQAINTMILALREREILADMLKESNKTKDKLFSIIAHDLKNPFNTLVGMSNVLIAEVESGQKDTVLELAKAIQEAASSGYALLVNLLEWTRLQSKRIVVSPAPVTLRTLILGTIHLQTPTAQNKGITILYDDSQDFPLTSDSNILNTILRNLISNAIKYTYPQGRIEVSVAQYLRGYQVSVTDNGVGIPPEVLNKMFRVDTLKSTRGTNNEGGTGLGLVLCEELAHMIGGEIAVDSVYGQGSTFTLYIPNLEEVQS